MELSGIRHLYQQMKKENVQHQQFRVKTGAVTFECIFSAPPFELSMTTHGTKNPEFFLFDIGKGFRIKDYLENSEYLRLLNLLKVDGQSQNPLVPKEWFEQINKQIPTELSIPPSKAEICRLRHDLEEREKPYFNTWIEWKKGQKLSEENLKKTLMTMGKDSYEYSLKNNFSARWSAIDLGR